MTDIGVSCATCLVMQDSLPATMSVAFLHPFFDEMLRRGANKSELAGRIGIGETSLYDALTLVPDNSVYAFLGWVADSTGDPLLCARIGERMSNGEWAPLVPLMTSAKTVGDFLQKFSLMSSEQGRAASYKLEVEGEVALWRLARAPGASNDAAYADAVAAGFFIGILKSAAQDDWDTAKTTAVLTDTALVSRDLLPSISVLSGQPGLILRFPSTYLGLDTPEISPPDDHTGLSVPDVQETTLADRVRQLIERRISNPSLGIEGVAKGVGLASWKLQSLLKEEDLSVSQIKDNVRRKLAIEQVASSSNTVASIAESLGYTNSSNFTRAFRGWTSKSP